MKHTAIEYTPKARLQFSLVELDIMLLCSQRHYDGVCREASAEMLLHEGNRPGIIRGMHNCVKNFGANQTHLLTFRQIDTIAKCLEIGLTLYDTEPERKVVLELSRGLSRALKALNDSALDPKGMS